MSCLVSQGVVFCQVGYLGFAFAVVAFLQTLIGAYLFGRYQADADV